MWHADQVLIVSLLPFVALRSGFTSRISKRLSSYCSGVSMIRVADDEYGVYLDGNVEVEREPTSIFQLYYRIYNPAGPRIPLVVLHGGPSLPSQYLYPLVSLVSSDRPVIFYDQLGCGNSDEPKDLTCYSNALSVRDLDVVIERAFAKVGLARMSSGDNEQQTRPSSSGQSEFHLFGHSYGGSLAYEYVREGLLTSNPSSSDATNRDKAIENICRSLILCSASQNMKVTNDEYDRLQAEKRKAFWTQHVCKKGIPSPLDNAFKHLGTTWHGMDCVIDFVALPMPNKEGSTVISHPPVLLLWGKDDFGYQSNNDKVWRPLLQTEVEAYEFGNCAHYPFYEEPEVFGRIVEEFMQRIETK